ncbi:hypothetical protein PNQ29_03315 [Halobacterium salinarum]|uniref:DUF7342 family protein n=1 Tax=Halobacterium salinarum TaxID=2242 RepID=UPI0025525426|nr:hypothetical protein [Halobacterium salinarum]MDL0118502.1 hypothetical protein [Halobacterium salinarum]MDL0118715.1 hypothetical protein [Halobacterium salinarum]MDL0118773.1 hypothetical protein [Halobacterium salinarum]
MTDEQPDVWSDDLDSEDRVRRVADTLTQPQSASWVADQAAVNYKTARKYLEKLVSDARLQTTERDQTTLYYPNPRTEFFDELDELVSQHTKDELTAELATMSDRIEDWQTAYDVADPNELRTSIDESLSVAERREREHVVDDWEYTQQMRMLVRHAIRLYDDLQQFTATHTPQRVEAGGSE